MGFVSISNGHLALLVVFAVCALMITDVWLLRAQTQHSRDLQTVKSQLLQSKSGVVDFPVTDYRLAVVFSMVGLSIGLAGGLLLGQKGCVCSDANRGRSNKKGPVRS